ncbi:MULTISPECIES: polysaccharide deacetylase family protein [unclassified Ruegeria]|uniref:polysaccharide deacetylase family protein n=1 Tax=unclassified Ruegeria TaxID=2625375 RepID=UPI0014885465|nr:MULTISPECIES: polysaccharide deacetylase family protein [unclassified Ruegeria]NOD62465.1 polysaccharide deacetylase [Ruegeria sp. HKCCD6109]
MTPDWHPLDTELDHWRASGLSFPLWWRDDDAVAPTPPLDQLADLSAELGLPVHLAVIPHDATPALAEYVADRPSLIPVVHGWAHKNHAPAGEKKAEFRLNRPLDQMVDDAKAGMARLDAMFGGNVRPMFVPPWNRIAPEMVAQLPRLGFRVLSTATPRQTPFAAPGLEQINTHLDPIDWRGTRGLINPDILIARTVDLLRDRREGRADNAEPFGILTHHLVHDQDIWTFTEALLRKLLNGPATIWVAPKNK